MKTKKMVLFVVLMILPLAVVSCDREVVLPDSDVPVEIKNYVAEHFSGDPILQSIKDYDVKESDFLGKLDEMTEQAFDDQCTGANPRYPLFEEIKALYLQAYYGNEYVK